MIGRLERGLLVVVRCRSIFGYERLQFLGRFEARFGKRLKLTFRERHSDRVLGFEFWILSALHRSDAEARELM